MKCRTAATLCIILELHPGFALRGPEGDLCLEPSEQYPDRGIECRDGQMYLEFDEEHTEVPEGLALLQRQANYRTQPSAPRSDAAARSSFPHPHFRHRFPATRRGDQPSPIVNQTWSLAGKPLHGISFQHSRPNASWQARGVWLLQHRSLFCNRSDPSSPCYGQSEQVVIILIGLLLAIGVSACILCFIKEDREHDLTPLCPQLQIKDPWMKFKVPIKPDADTVDVTDMEDRFMCKVVMDWPDPFRPASGSILATVSLQNAAGHTLATVVAKQVAVIGQGLALCRAGCEIFGFVEPESDGRYHVHHRTGVHLLTLVGDFAGIDIEGWNPAGSKVFTVKKNGKPEAIAHAVQFVDAGLLLCSLFAIQVHRRLLANVPGNIVAQSPSVASLTSLARSVEASTPKRASPPPERNESPASAERMLMGNSRNTSTNSMSDALATIMSPRQSPSCGGDVQGREASRDALSS